MEHNINFTDNTGTDKELVRSIEEKLAPTATTNKKLGVALVGLGTYSSSQLAPALLQTQYCYLAGIVTGSAEKIPEWKNKYGIKDENIYSYDNFDEIKNNTEIDIVYIVLPNSLHAEYVKRAAAAGKHVICEKPMAVTVEECDEMLAACNAAGKMLSVGYRLHFDPYHAEMMKLGQGQVYGKLKYIHAQHGSDDTKGWRLNAKLAGGGPLMDLGIYCLQAACYTSGLEPIAVKVTNHKMRGDIEERLDWEMEFADGLTVACETSYEEKMNLLHADGEHGWMTLSPAFSYGGLTGKTATGFMDLLPVNQQALQMDHFACAILENLPVLVDGKMGKRDVQIIEAIYESMRNGGNRIELGLS